MADLTSPPFVILFACSWSFVLCQGTQELNVKAGEDATLQCRSPGGADIIVLRWTRADLKPDDGLVYFSPDQINREYQNSLFHGRVELQDPEMKNGDASVILKNVNVNDTGTYECWIRERNRSRRSKRDAAQPICTIKLSVIGTKEVKVNPGDNATLPCRGHRDATIEVIKWIRPDLKSDSINVFFFRDGRSRENDQHEFFRGRVELRDPEMKDRDVSVILKNVTFNDTGTYECRVREKNETGKPKLILTIRLTVTEPGHTAGHKEGNLGLKVGLPVGVILLLVLLCGIAYLISKKCRGPTDNEHTTNAYELQKLQ